jgi:glycerol-3-phosphate O-acyltransferase/dihydroxyacetone phosphate acyltransferase
VSSHVQVIQAARRLYRIPGQHLTLGQVVELNKRFMEGYLRYQHEPKIIELRTRVLSYNRLLRDMGIADHQVERASNKSIKSFLLLIYRTGLLLWWGMLSLPGVILHAPVFILAKTISHKKAKGTSPSGQVTADGLTGCRSSCCIDRQDPRPRRTGHMEGPGFARSRSPDLCLLRHDSRNLCLPQR